jgi:hypothetical protein
VDNKIHIHYNLANGGLEDPHNISLRFITDKQELVDPYHLNGDIGPGILPGSEKNIIWDVSQDLAGLDNKLSPLIISDLGLSSQSIGSGPGAVLLSILVPGLGDYFVADRREMKFKPLYRTILALGCTSLGTYAALNRTKGEDKYALSQDPTGRYYRRLPTTPTYSEKFYGYGDTEYALFKGDAEVLLAAGVAVWLYDIIWVYAKGNLNKRLRASFQTNQLSMHPVQGGATLSLSLNF